MQCKTFEYKGKRECSFKVGNYLYNPQCMSIMIVNDIDEGETVCTVNMKNYMYFPETTTIKNYSENSGMTDFLLKLGIIEQVYSKVPAHQNAQKGETIDFCQINVEKLKEYSQEFKYEWKI